MSRPRFGTHEVVAKVIDAIGAREGANGVTVVAKFLGVGTTTVYKWMDADQDGEISFARLRLLTEHFGVSDAAEDLSRLAGGEFVPSTVTPSGASWTKKIVEKTLLGAHTVETIGAAVEDLKIDGREAEDILTALRAEMENLRRIEARVIAEVTKSAGFRPVSGAGR